MFFLEKIADEVLNQFEGKLGDIAIVFPSRRAGLFFKKIIKEKLNAISWEPKITTIEDFVFELNDLELIDNITLLFEFYEVYKKTEIQEQESFDQFVSWASSLLQDFEELDKHLTDAEALFGYLSETKALEQWNVNGEALSDLQEKYLQFWQLMGKFYFALKKRLLKNKMAYPGLAFRHLVEQLDFILPDLEYEQIIFVGFSALNKSEERIFEKFVDAKKAKIYWDTDNYYIKDKTQEAGKKMRNYAKNKHFGNFNWVFDDLSSKEKEVEIIGVPNNIGQAKLAGHLIENQILKAEDLPNTAVVLADENLLFPVLSALPEKVKNLNITMGYPFDHTPLFNLIKAIFNLQQNARDLALSSKRKTISFHYKDIFNVLSHAYVSYLHPNAFENLRLIQKIQKSNRTLLSSSQLTKFIQAVFQDAKDHQNLDYLFEVWKNPSHALQQLELITEFLQAKSKELFEQKNQHKKNRKNSKDAVVAESLFALMSVLKRVRNLNETYFNLQDLDTFQRLVQDLLIKETIPFVGEPLKGLQVMGMLETRVLDFENVILLSVNEGILPVGRTQNTFIPLDIKSKFGIPTHQEKDAIAAYHFYRLSQRAKKIFYVYNTEADVLGGGEKSRFLLQMEYELPIANPEAKIKSYFAQLNLKENLVLERKIKIEKTEAVLKKLNERLTEKGVSATMLNDFIRCELRFYFKYIAEIIAPENTLETIDAAIMGTILHGVLEAIYLPYLNKTIGEKEILEMQKVAPIVLKEQLEKQYQDGDASNGKNYLIVEICGHYIQKFLEKEKELLEAKSLKIKGLEQKIEVNYPIEIKNEKKNILIKGTIDRVDEFENQLRLIDYKTGSFNPRDITVKELEIITEDKKHAKALQLMYYAFLYQKHQPDLAQEMYSGIYAFRQMDDGFHPFQIGERQKKSPIIDSERLKTFEIQFNEILEKMYDNTKKYSQTEDLSACQYCEFKGICNRN